MHYFSSGFVGSVDEFTITMAGENAGYEARKGWSVDRNEHLVYTSSILLKTEFASAGVQAVYMDSDEVWSDTARDLYLKRDTTTQTPTAVYGHDNLQIVGNHIEISSGVPSRVLMLATYPSQGSYYDYRIQIDYTVDDRIQTLMHGILYDMPINRREVRDYAHMYPVSTVGVNLLGGVKFDGLANPGLKRTHTVIFEEISETEKDMLIAIYTLGKSGLPVLWVDDTDDDQDWMLVGLKTLNILEPYVQAFTCTLNMEEF